MLIDAEGRLSGWGGDARLAGATIYADLFAPEDRSAGRPEAILATAKDEGHFEGEAWRLDQAGQRVRLRLAVERLEGPASPAAYVEIATPIRPGTAAGGLESEDFRLLVQSVTDYAIYRIDPNGLVSTWNAGAQRIKGYAPEEIIGRSFATFYTEEDRVTGEPQRALETARREGRFEKEGWRVRKDGSRFWANVVLDPIRDATGAIIGFAKVTRDITERRAAQKALEEAREALFQSQKLEAIGQLTGGIAHDFNNLLMAVMGSLDLLRKRVPDDPKILRLVDNATRGTLRGAALTQRMLAFARRQELETRAVALPELVGGMAELLERSLGPSIVIERRFPPGLPFASTDANQLESALINLVVNARDAMPNGGTVLIAGREATVAEGSDPALRPGSYVVLTVEDTGTGMDAATLARVMEPFFTTKGPGKGTGLGLPMVRALAEQSGGTLRVNSTLGVGTVAELWLPVAVPSGPDADLPLAPISAPEELRILALDDDPLVLMNTEEMLSDLGHRVEAVNTPAAALERLRGGGFDLMVTDQSMPGMTGTQLAELLYTEGIRLPIVLATGYFDVQLDAKLAITPLGKPFREADLALAITRAMHGD